MSAKSNSVLVIISEGPTDEEFYKALIKHLKKRFGVSNQLEIKYITANGIGNMENKIIAKYKHEFCQGKYKNYEKIACFCYDKDVFVNNTNPPINRERIRKEIKATGAQIIEIVAKMMIEDFFLYDLNGIKKYLNLGKNYKIPKKKSLALIKQMFSDASKIYHKGSGCKDLIGKLDMEVILSNICSQVQPLCMLLGITCNQSACKMKKN